jgi:hypothetical protein
MDRCAQASLPLVADCVEEVRELATDNAISARALGCA